jgi:pilus assembly protein Flp/PilA
MKELAKRFIRDEKGLETVEWTIMAALVILGLVAAITALQGKIGDVFTALGAELDSSHD